MGKGGAGGVKGGREVQKRGDADTKMKKKPSFGNSQNRGQEHIWGDQGLGKKGDRTRVDKKTGLVASGGFAKLEGTVKQKWGGEKRKGRREAIEGGKFEKERGREGKKGGRKTKLASEKRREAF